MHAHSFATQERTQASPQMLRGVAGSCVPVPGVPAATPVLGGGIRGGRAEAANPSAKTWFSGSDGDFGSSVGEGPV